MRKTVDILRLTPVASALMLMQACGAPESSQSDTDPASMAASVEEVQQSPAVSIEEQRPITPEAPAGETDGAYFLEWSKGDPVCADALAALNRSTRGARDESEEDYAARQARAFLATDASVAWREQEPPVSGSKASQLATVDYFNDGVERTVIRMRGELAGQSVITLGIADPKDPKIARLSFAYAGATLEDLPDKDNLNTKLAYSVSDVINLPTGYFTLLMPLEDVDGSGRIYLAQWRAKEGSKPPRAPNDYYAELTCVYRADGFAEATE